MIISHRGYWKSKEEKNTAKAFERSFLLGFGTETDVRDFNGELVISHDIPKQKTLTVNDFFEIYNAIDNSLLLALNIKSDGLHLPLKELLVKHNINNYFVFDMSIPDSLGYLKGNFNTYTRQSEFEQLPSFYTRSCGVWLDEFEDRWISVSKIKEHLVNDKSVCIVSPELHKKNPIRRWEYFKSNLDIANSNNIHICTDFPVKAKQFFNEKN